MDVFDAFNDAPVPPGGFMAGPTHKPGGHVSGLEQRVSELETRLNRLALVTHSLWEMLKDRHGYT